MPWNLHSLVARASGLLVGFALSAGAAWGHDLTASHVIVRLTATELELQIKIAADSAWPLVQEKSPGALYVQEDYDTVARPLLLNLAKTLTDTSIDGKTVEPTKTDVVVAEDTFLFAYHYAVPAQGVFRLAETYLAKMPADYVSYVRLFDRNGKLTSSKTLTQKDLSCEIPLAVGQAVPVSPPTSPAPKS